MTAPKPDKRSPEEIAEEVYAEMYAGCDNCTSHPKAFHDRKRIASVIRAEREKLARAVEALEFYADKYHWGHEEGIGSPDEPDAEWVHYVMEDEGEIARAALKEIKGEG